MYFNPAFQLHGKDTPIRARSRAAEMIADIMNSKITPIVMNLETDVKTSPEYKLLMEAPVEVIRKAVDILK